MKIKNNIRRLIKEKFYKMVKGKQEKLDQFKKNMDVMKVLKLKNHIKKLIKEKFYKIVKGK